MAVKVGDMKLKKLAACAGILQSVTWTVAMCIMLYYSPVTPNDYSSFMEFVQFTIYQILLQTSQELVPNQIFSGTVFNVFVWFYALLHAVWLIVSIYLFFKNTPRALKIWSYCTLLISFLDFTTVVILGVDYKKCLVFGKGYSNEISVIMHQQLCTDSFLPPFIIAVKGFTLWIFNIVLGVILERKSRQLSQKSKPEESHDQLSPSPYADTYKMDHSKRGTAVIFNHVDFSHPECSTREGSDKDRDDLVEMFHDLNFDVSVHNDLTAHDIASVLITVSRMDHTDSDCLAIVVMSHGNNGKLYARDREYPTRTIWEYFTANNCPTLAGKPKLLFVQACRGSCLHSAATLHYQTGGVEEDSSSVDAYYSIPVMADILVMYSTVEDLGEAQHLTKLNISSSLTTALSKGYEMSRKYESTKLLDVLLPSVAILHKMALINI